MTDVERRKRGLARLAELGDEPGEGAHTDPGATAKAIKAALLASLARISRLDTESLLATRYARLRGIGVYRESEVGPRAALGEPSLRRRIGRLLHLPGVPRRPRWSEIWPSGDDNNDSERGA